MASFSAGQTIVREEKKLPVEKKDLERILQPESPVKEITVDFDTKDYLDVLEKIYHEVVKEKTSE
jgi:hypothetical protein